MAPLTYNGTLDLRLTPGHLKHYGESIFDANNYYLRPFLDPAVAFVGTKDDNPNDGDGVSAWDAETRARYREWMGWNEYAKTLTGVTPAQAQQVFIWQHRAEGSDALGREAGSYDDKPDWNGEVSLSGPVPAISDKLGDLTFFASHRSNNELFALPTNRDYYKERNSHLKLTSRISSSMKLMVEGLYSLTNTVQSAPRADGLDAYMISGMDILYSPIATGYDYVLGQNAALYYPAALNRFDIRRSMVGLAFDHVLSPSTFYSLRVSMTKVENDCIGPSSLDTKSNRFRDQSTITSFGSYEVDETPFGYQVGIESMFDGMSTTGEGSVVDYSKVNTVAGRFDITSQVNKNHQVKAGLVFNYDDLDMHYEHNQIGDTGNNWVVEWQREPYRAGAYLQDKLEFKGLIANVGVRADMSFPNAKSFKVDPFSQYFRKKFADTFQDIAPSEPAKNRIEISPRLGISHPISDVAKLYFNYGHFYSQPTTDEMFLIMKRSRGLSDIGNPNLELPRTVAYELGLEYSLSEMFLLHVSGYYKDVTNQLANRHYVGFDGGVDYWSRTNDNYEDIRGLELRLEKRFGKWITGWANYNYLVETIGELGRETYYEDTRRQEQEGLDDPNLARPQARPIARANITISSPNDFGPRLGDARPFGDMRLDVLYQWRAGKYETRAGYQSWNPVGDVDDLDDMQWKGRTSVDMRLRRGLSVLGLDMGLFIDVTNVFNMKHLEESGFASASDRTAYLKSLHLARYNGDAAATKEEYAARGYIAGDDKPGDVKRDDKPYIDMPNRGFLTYLNPRTVTFGLAVNF